MQQSSDSDLEVMDAPWAPLGRFDNGIEVAEQCPAQCRQGCGSAGGVGGGSRHDDTPDIFHGCRLRVRLTQLLLDAGLGAVGQATQEAEELAREVFGQPGGGGVGVAGCRSQGAAARCAGDRLLGGLGRALECRGVSGALERSSGHGLAGGSRVILGVGARHGVGGVGDGDGGGGSSSLLALLLALEFLDLQAGSLQLLVHAGVVLAQAALLKALISDLLGHGVDEGGQVRRIGERRRAGQSDTGSSSGGSCNSSSCWVVAPGPGASGTWLGSGGWVGSWGMAITGTIAVELLAALFAYLVFDASNLGVTQAGPEVVVPRTLGAVVEPIMRVDAIVAHR